jgi:acyl-CoA dehydrogenase
MTLPEAYGGGGKDAFHRFVLAEELLCRGAPVSAHWIADRQSGPLILKYGTQAQRDFFLPRICKAEVFFCIGMSEPQSGSDLAGLRTRATRTAEGWLLKGQKLWTTNAHRAHYMIALVRSSGTPEDRHQGLSQMIVDLSLPGITVRTIGDLTGDQHFNEVFFDDVLLPHDALIGEEGAGWAQVTAELAFERSGPERIYGSMVLFDAWQALQRGAASANGALPARLPGSEHLLVLRRAIGIELQRLSPDQFRWLAAVKAGARLGELVGDRPDDDSGDTGARLRRWAAQGVITGFSVKVAS